MGVNTCERVVVVVTVVVLDLLDQLLGSGSS
jgi:hypothetical protein